MVALSCLTSQNVKTVDEAVINYRCRRGCEDRFRLRTVHARADNYELGASKYISKILKW